MRDGGRETKKATNQWSKERMKEEEEEGEDQNDPFGGSDAVWMDVLSL